MLATRSKTGHGGGAYRETDTVSKSAKKRVATCATRSDPPTIALVDRCVCYEALTARVCSVTTAALTNSTCSATPHYASRQGSPYYTLSGVPGDRNSRRDRQENASEARRRGFGVGAEGRAASVPAEGSGSSNRGAHRGSTYWSCRTRALHDTCCTARSHHEGPHLPCVAMSEPERVHKGEAWADACCPGYHRERPSRWGQV